LDKSNEKKKDKGMTYADSGVDIKRTDKAIDRIKSLVRKTYTDGVPEDIGGFAGFFRPDLSGISKPVLVSSTDGVGTKILIARKMNRFNTIGIDLIAMVVNDIICVGAKPLFALDYIGIGKFDDDIYEKIIEGIVEGCRQAGCALIGGETAELPDIYPPGEFDLAAFGVGIVDEKKIINGSGIREGDVILGLESSGFHSNGYSLIRKIIEEKAPYNYVEKVEELNSYLGQVLLKPTRIYVKPILDLLDKGIEIQGIANITGGGLTNNIPRILSDNLNARVDISSWRVPKEIELVVKWGKVSQEEKFKVFNMGIGMVIVLRGGVVEEAQNLLNEQELNSWIIGSIVSGKGEVVLTR